MENIKKLILLFEKEYLNNLHSLVENDKTINLSSVNLNVFSFEFNQERYFAFFKDLFSYKDELFNSNLYNSFSLLNSQVNFEIESRVKNNNSISNKFDRYIYKRSQKGHVPIKKCFNDLFGARAIIDCDSLKDLENAVRKASSVLTINNKTFDSSKNGYFGIHLYLYKDNFSFPWELQFWRKKDRSSNRASHAKHKQGYTSWESQLKNDDIIKLDGDVEQ